MDSLLFADIIFIAAYWLSTGYEHCIFSCEIHTDALKNMW